MKVLQVSPDGDSKFQIIRTNDNERTQSQIQTLLNVAHNLGDILVLVADSGTEIDVDEAVVASAIETYLSVNVQLRNIIDDMPRWQRSDDNAEKISEQLVNSGLATARKQQALLDEQNRPYRKLGVQLRLFQSGWVAWTGGTEPNTSLLHAVGQSPEEALENFDKNYARVLDTSLVKVEKPTAEKPRSKKKPLSKL
jgi:hypothetical protein